VAANLKGRLARINKSRQAAHESPAQGGEGAKRPKPAFLSGWEREDDFVWTRKLASDNPLPPSVDGAAFAPLRRKGSVHPPRLVEAGELRLFDLETTGLSGGTGTIAFLASIGRIGEGGDFELTQVFLEDYPGEKAFVAAVLGLLGEGATVVSYNGKAFDMPLLRTRCVMNGLEPPVLAHIDALFACRRLWKSVHGGASLGLLEVEVLGRDRGEDVPGSMIPEIWLAFAKSGAAPLMELVLSHNAQDVIGLAKLLSRVQAVFDDPLSLVARSDIDRSGLGRSLLACGREAEGEELLEAAAGDGDERAALLLSSRYRRARRLEDCLRVEGLLGGSYRAAVERAKLHERWSGDLEAAARWAKEALELAGSEAEKTSAMARLRRIQKKRGEAE
jgi:uncharacterized protein YprB with RNaseH-like and TPR domain